MRSNSLPASISQQNFRKGKFKIVPAKAVLLVIDMQRYFLEKGSHAYLKHGEAAIGNVNRLMTGFRAAGAMVVHTRHMHSKGHDPGMLGKWWSDLMTEGDALIELDPRLDRADADTVVRKDRYDAFLGTDLDGILKARGITQVVITGVMTDLCCETTARCAFCRDYEVFIIQDATGTTTRALHNAALSTLAHGFAVILSTKEALKQVGVKA